MPAATRTRQGRPVLSPPTGDQFEISVFGPGLGESVVIHLGDGKWIVVDSCSESGVSVPLKYLTELNVDITRDVVMVVATHAHDDHVGGLADLYVEAKSALLGLPQAAERTQLAALLALDGKQLDVRLRVFTQLQRIVEELRTRTHLVPRVWFGSSWRYAVVRDTDPSVEVVALTPSDEDLLLALEDMSQMVAQSHDGPRRQLSRRDPNNFAMALSVRAGDRRVLLGSDVLAGDSSGRTGWSAVIPDAARLTPAEAFKVAHHGSVTAHHDGIWTDLTNRPVAIIAPFEQGSVRLPTASDLARIAPLAAETWITAGSPTTPRSIQQSALALGARGTPKLRRGRLGQVRARSPLKGPAAWSVQGFGVARKVS